MVWCTGHWIVDESKNISVPCYFENDNGGKNELMFYTLWHNKSLETTRLFRPTSWPMPKD